MAGRGRDLFWFDAELILALEKLVRKTDSSMIAGAHPAPQTSTCSSVCISPCYARTIKLYQHTHEQDQCEDLGTQRERLQWLHAQRAWSRMPHSWYRC